MTGTAAAATTAVATASAAAPGATSARVSRARATASKKRLAPVADAEENDENDGGGAPPTVEVAATGAWLLCTIMHSGAACSPAVATKFVLLIVDNFIAVHPVKHQATLPTMELCEQQ